MTCTFRQKLEYPSKTLGIEVVNDRTVQKYLGICVDLISDNNYTPFRELLNSNKSHPD